MTLDHYSLCPCGSGKKIKFCCSNDILPELEKVYRAIEGEQRNAAVDQLNHLMEFKGKRLSLLALKAELQVMLQDGEGATQTTNEFLQKDGHNPLALCLATLAGVLRADVAAAVQKLHRALEASIERKIIHETLFDAIQGVASLMLATGDILGARAYYLLESLLQSEDGQMQPSEGLGGIDRNPNLLPLLKQEFEARDCSPTVVWRDEFAAAQTLFRQGMWWKACEAFEALATRYSGQPSILFNLAVLRSRLGNAHLAQSAWRAYASLPTVPLEDAVEAMATARIIDMRNDETIDIVNVSFPLSETERVMERLLSNRRFIATPRVQEEWDLEEGPPPKGAFVLLDRPQLASADNLTLESLPVSLGTVLVFGRQTDRDARLEFSGPQNATLSGSLEAIREACGESIGAAGAPAVANKIPALSELLEIGLAFPTGTTAEQHEEISKAARRRALFEIWPNRAWKSLDGKRPCDVAADPACRVRVLAEILLLEQRHANGEFGMDFNELRTKLGLPTLEPIDGQGLDLVRLPLPRLPRVIIEKLDDAQLATVLERAHYFALTPLKRRAADEVLKRDSLTNGAVRLLALAAAAQTARSISEATQRYQEAAVLAQSLERSPAPYLIGELQVRLYAGEPERVTELVQRLQQRHFQEPGVGEAVMQLLRPFLQTLPDGRTLLRLPRMGAAPGGAPAAAATTKPGGGLWTPDQGSPPPPVAAAPAAAPTKSKLWVPGMD